MKKGAFCLLLSLFPLIAGAAETPISSKTPTITLIIDDIGDSLRYGLRAVRLPGAVTCAFLPHTPFARQLAVAAHKRHKDVMLHLPMESEDGRYPGPGSITLNMTHSEFLKTLRNDLDAIPYVAGINNHMGSLITRHPGHMAWLMQEINHRGNLYFVDSRTTEATVAQRVAQETGVPNLRRNVFLDNVQSLKAIARQFDHLLALAKRYGSAVAIGHPHPTTLRFLEERLPQLNAEGIQLVSASQMIALKRNAKQRYAAAPLVLGAAKVAEPASPSAVVTP